MTDYMLLMHNDIVGVRQEDWEPYFSRLRASGAFEGGSAIGGGLCVRKSGAGPAITSHLGGFLRVTADSIDAARALLDGNPVFEAGGTVEIRELPRGQA